VTDPIRITQPLLDVLEMLILALRDDVDVHGWAIMKAAHRSGPTVYGVLDRLESAGWVTARWEDVPANVNRPRRRLYRLTATGNSAASKLLAERRPSRSTVDSPLFRPGLLGRLRGMPRGGRGATT